VPVVSLIRSTRFSIERFGAGSLEKSVNSLSRFARPLTS
jgi:hypothetical protein